MKEIKPDVSDKEQKPDRDQWRKALNNFLETQKREDIEEWLINDRKRMAQLDEQDKYTDMICQARDQFKPEDFRKFLKNNFLLQLK